MKLRKQENHIYEKNGQTYVKFMVCKDPRQLMFYCPFCNEMHVHGNPDNEKNQGTRCPHCYKTDGYKNYKGEYYLIRDKLIDKEKDIYETEVRNK